MFWEVTATLLILVICLWLRWRMKQIRILKDLGIPGPKPNIIFGNMWELYKKGPLKCHEEWFKKYGKVFGYYFGMRPAIMIGDIDVMKQVQIKNFHSFTDRPNNLLQLQDDNDTFVLKHLINQRGKVWKKTRSLLSPAFTSGKLKQMVPAMINAVDELLKLIDEKARKGLDFDIYAMWQGLTADVIGRTAFGIEAGVQRDREHPLLRSARSFFAAVHFQSILFLLGFSFKEFGRFFLSLRKLQMKFLNKFENPVLKLNDGLSEVIKCRRENNLNRSDLLQSLMDAKITTDIKNVNVNQLTAADDSEDEEVSTNASVSNGILSAKEQFLSDGEVKANAIMIYLAGYETTSTALGFTSYALIKYPDIQESLRKELRQVVEKEGEFSATSIQKLPYLDQVFSESLRVYPPIYMFVNREAVEDINIGNISIPKGMAVQVPVYWLHHNPEYWEDPEKFDPKRFERDPHAKSKLAWQPFGAGPRNCIGMRFALMEAKLALAKLLLQYRLESCDRTEKGDIRMRMGLPILSPLAGVYLRAVPL